jgi:hypothetical protein
VAPWDYESNNQVGLGVRKKGGEKEGERKRIDVK